MGFMRRLINANVAASQRLARAFALPTDKTLWQSFEREVQEDIRALPDGSVVLDVGGGRRCVYHHALRPEIELIATDVSVEELGQNPHASRTVVADVSEHLPLPDESADLVISRAVLEHVPDVRAAARNMAAVMKPGATTMHLLPGRNSLFGLAARLLPFTPLLTVLHWVDPSTVGRTEFDVHYDQGTPDQLKAAFEAAGLRDVSVEVTWAQPEYFEPVFPVFILYSLYEWVTRRLQIRSLAAYMVLRARKAPGATAQHPLSV
jgi:ubiquinone/menaquinone biosynthesis C-methylase UbiE